MNIVVCVKRVPMTQEVDLEIDASGKDVKADMLAYVLNEWDNYAVEEAIQLKEKTGGTVVAVTIGSEDDEEVLRRCLAMGADKAVRVDPGDRPMDGLVKSRILAEVVKGMEYDLVLTGVQSDDVNDGMVGVLLAEQLDAPHAAVVTGIDPQDGGAGVKVELEGGMDELSRVNLPAVLSIQTGINEPRYVSIMGIRKAAKKELNVVPLADLGIDEDALTPMTTVEEYFFPPETEGAEILEGDAASVAEQILKIIKEKGVSI
ncbi:MAG: electron transfer flavoprotein subunit beta/FixA family protein [Deltaproteobacteria bacterium]|nr:electron transfer flavoprotein subunit beta/FixA family protein [Deltaproteobacteria bacterium]